MKYTLMHKNIEVADIEIDEAIGGITTIYDVSTSEHLPIGVYIRQNGKDFIDRYALNQWWFRRLIPPSRTGVSDALETLKTSASGLAIESL